MLPWEYEALLNCSRLISFPNKIIERVCGRDEAAGAKCPGARPSARPPAFASAPPAQPVLRHALASVKGIRY